MTRLFPNMKFGCFGTIVRFIAAVWNTGGDQAPRIQIWREDKIQPGLYHKISPTIQIKKSDSTDPCYQRDLSNSLFQCTLKKSYRIPVQPGDFLGLESPSHSNDDYVLYFKAGGSPSLVFQRQLGSTVDLFTTTHTITNDEPQITFLVVLGKKIIAGCYKLCMINIITSNDIVFYR